MFQLMITGSSQLKVSRFGSDNINIQPPGKVAYGHYYTHVFFEDTQRWYELEQEIYSAYLEKKNESKEIDINEINI